MDDQSYPAMSFPVILAGSRMIMEVVVTGISLSYGPRPDVRAIVHRPSVPFLSIRFHGDLRRL